MLGVLKKIQKETTSPSRLSIFRILFGVVLFVEVFGIWQWRRMIFTPESPFFLLRETGLLAWFFVLICVIIGYQTRLFLWLNYALTVVFLGFLSRFSYAFDGIVLSVSFLWCFLPVAKIWSIDALIYKRKSQKISYLYVWLLFIFGIGLMYFNSAIFKIQNPAWQAGLGLWSAGAKAHFSWHTAFVPYQIEVLIKALSWLFVGFEIVVCFVVHKPKFRVWLALGVAVLHLATLYTIPIVNFQAGCLCFVVLLFPETWFEWLDARWNTFFAEHQSSKPNFSFPDKWLKPFLGYVLVGYIFTHIPPEKIGKISVPFRWVNAHFLGMKAHGMFREETTPGTYRLWNISHAGKFLPLFTTDTRPAAYLHGRGFGYGQGFLATPDGKMTEPQRAYLQRVIRFWCEENGLSPEKETFVLWEKTLPRPSHWQPNFIEIQRTIPWERMGFFK